MSITAIDNPILDDLAGLVDADPACCDRVALRELVATQRRVQGWLDAYAIKVARRSRQLTETERPAQPVEPKDVIASLLDAGCNSGKDAKATTTREGVCADLPGFEDALAAGDVSAAHLDALGNLTRNLTAEERADLRDRADELVDHARGEFAETFTKTARSIIDQIRARHRPTAAEDELEQQRKASKITEWVDRTTGMHKTMIELDPIRAASLKLAVLDELGRLRREPANAKRTYDELKVEAFLNLTTATRDHTPGERRVPEVVVVIDWNTLRDGVQAAGGICELADGTPVPVSTVRQMAVDADIIPVVLGGHGEPLDVGRTRRLATAAQRAALTAMYTGCVEPGCDRPVHDCRAHHTDPWQAGGETNLDHLALVCDATHERIHRDGWHLQIHDNHRTITWTRPDGTIAYHGPPPNRRRRQIDDPG